MLLTCARCEVTKDSEEFYNNKNLRNGKTIYCKECMNKQNKKYKEDNWDKWKEYSRTYYTNRGKKDWGKLIFQRLATGTQNLHLTSRHTFNIKYFPDSLEEGRVEIRWRGIEYTTPVGGNITKDVYESRAIAVVTTRLRTYKNFTFDIVSEVAEGDPMKGKITIHYKRTYITDMYKKE